MKKNAFFLLVALMSINQGFSQVLEKEPETRVQFTSFGYPMFLNGEQHSSIGVNVILLEDLHAEIEGFYDTYALESRFRISAQLKKMLGAGFYLMGGTEFEGNIGESHVPLERVPRIGAIGGLGYEVNQFMMLELRGNISINQSTMGPYGEQIPMPKVFTLGGKMRF